MMFLLAANAAAQGTTPRLNPPSSNPPIANSYPGVFGPSGALPQPSPTQLVRRYLGVPADTFVETRRELMRMFLMRLQVDAQNADLHTLPTSSGKLAILFDQQRQDILVEGPANLVGQFSTLVEATYQRHRQGNSPEASHRVLLLQRTNRDELIRAMQAAPKPGPRDGTANGPAWLGMRPASFTKQPPQDPNPPVNPPQLGPPDASSMQDPNRPRLPQFDGVQIESLPDLDAIILRGRNAELDQLAEIIKQLEEVSRLTQPTIEVVTLESTDAGQIAAIIEKSQVSLNGTRQGKAYVAPLDATNSLLVIGWGDAVAATKELISKLDQAVSPDSRFEVIRLKHAQAAAVQTSLQSFFAGRQGSAPVIQSTTDARSNSLIVRAAPRELAEIRQLIQQLDVTQGNAKQTARVFQIRHSLASDIAQTLQQAIQGGTSTANRNMAIELLDDEGRPLATSGILENTQITVNDRNNTLIVSSQSENLELIAQLIEQLDTPGMVSKIKIFPIKNGDAASLVETLRSLLPSQSGANNGPQLSSAPNDSSLAPLRFTVDVRGNNIVATGSDGDLKIVEALIFRLDESDGMQRKSIVYQLKNSPAIDVALAINDFLRNQRQVENAVPGQQNPFAQLEKEVVVVPEPVGNKLILSATPRYFEEISKLIQKLDEQPAQVMIQVMIAEITLSDAEEFGVELGLQDTVLFDRSLLGNLLKTTTTTTTSTPAGLVTTQQENIIAASNQPGFDFNSTLPLGNSGSQQALAGAGNVGGQSISNFTLGRSNTELGFGGLVLSASSQNISFLLRALQESRRLEVLSRPQILTLDNQPAFIQVGQRVPRIVNSTVNLNFVQNTVGLENVGLIIGVTPRISPEGNVVMEIDAEKSSLGPETEGIPISVSNNGTVIRSPRIDTTTAQTTVSAADGETIILGGLITKSTRQQHRKVPWLGDIPIIKNFFRYDSLIGKRTELLIVLTPRVVRSQDDMERVKQAEFARMSWCASDVFNLHGDVHMTNLGIQLPQNGNWDTIYPDDDPRGESVPPRPIDGLPGNPQSPLNPLYQYEPTVVPSSESSSQQPTPTAAEPRVANANMSGRPPAMSSGRVIPAQYQAAPGNQR